MSAASPSALAAAPPDARALGRVGVLFGGRSAEREISLRSGAAVLAALQRSGVDAHGFDPAHQGLGQLEAAGFERAFLVLHGRYGEDGAIQGVLETLRIPYTGSGVLASAIAIDKVMTKRIWQTQGLPTPRWLELDVAAASGVRAQDLAGRLGPELIVKPVSEGSTLGVSRVDAADAAAVVAALAEVRRFEGRALIEERIRGRELTCAVLGEGAQARALPLVEIRAPDANYDYHNKYFGNATEYLCPAPLDDALSARLGALCVQAYRAIGARGWGRIDFLLRPDADGVEQPWLLEINTAPGMTDHSLVPLAARAAGIDFAELVLGILAAARVEIGT